MKGLCFTATPAQEQSSVWCREARVCGDTERISVGVRANTTAGLGRGWEFYLGPAESEDGLCGI